MHAVRSHICVMGTLGNYSRRGRRECGETAAAALVRVAHRHMYSTGVMVP